MTISLLVFAASLPTRAQGADPQVGDCVRLQAFSHLGVPLHPAAGTHGVSGRLADDTVAQVDAFDAPTGWYRVTDGPVTGWIIRKYVDAIVPCGSGGGETTYVVGTWNLEHFHAGTPRGFPENTRGGPSIPARSDSDIEAVAAIIEAIGARILVLQEIFGRDVGDAEVVSDELDQLLDVLGRDQYDYVLGSSGGAQRIAILYDQRAARLNAACETNFPEERVQNKNLFDRQALLAHFTLLDHGQPMNDLVVVGVHLASGQRRHKNHDKAMAMLVDELQLARQEEWCIPLDEHDILIAGDFNASRFHDPEEKFWDRMEDDGWDVLADAAADYPPTRLAGVPLASRSIIDYIIVSHGSQGLQGEELTAATATVHQTLVVNPNEFRASASDHIPVTVSIRVMPDTDVAGPD